MPKNPFIVFDTETSGLPKNYKAPPSDINNWPRMVEIAWAVFDETGEQLRSHEHLIKPVGFVIPEEATKVHGITMEKAVSEGQPIQQIISFLIDDMDRCSVMVGHNILYDLNVVESEIFRMGQRWVGPRPVQVDTMMAGIEVCKIPGKFSGYKWPKLSELYQTLFGEEIQNAHSSLGDVLSTARCYVEMVKRGAIK